MRAPYSRVWTHNYNAKDSDMTTPFINQLGVVRRGIKRADATAVEQLGRLLLPARGVQGVDHPE